VLTRVQGASGYASDVTKGKMDAVRKTILAKEGATNAVGYQALAEANQIFIRGLEAISTNASLNDQQRALINRNIQDAAEAIPFTVKDAFDYGRANYKGTMKEFLESTGRKGRQLERIRSETPEIKEVNLREAAEAKIAAGGDPEAVKKRFKELTGEEF